MAAATSTTFPMCAARGIQQAVTHCCHPLPPFALSLAPLPWWLLCAQKMTHVKGEFEFLFPPYSAFEVISVDVKDTATWIIPHVVTIKAFPENKFELDPRAREDLELSPWH